GSKRIDRGRTFGASPRRAAPAAATLDRIGRYRRRLYPTTDARRDVAVETIGRARALAACESGARESGLRAATRLAHSARLMNGRPDRNVAFSSPGRPALDTDVLPWNHRDPRRGRIASLRSSRARSSRAPSGG